MTDTQAQAFRRAQWRFIFCSMIAYAFFYLTRKNLSMAQPGMLEEGVISIYTIGGILTVHGVLYGLSRFVNGFWADRLNGRIFMTIGLSIAVVVSLLAGFVPGMRGFVTCSLAGHTWTFNAVCISSLLFGLFWTVNAWAQGMGFPPCAKMLTHWIHPKELATKMSIWNTSHSFGAVMALGLCSLLLGPLGLGWRWCFWVPAALAAGAAVFCFFFVKDSPTEAGVPELEIEGATTSHTSTITTAERRRLVFGNKVIWLIAIANFFVYIVRFGFLDWGPTFLWQFKGIPVAKGGLMIIAFELAAVVGTIFAGWVTDKVFKGRGVRTCVFCMLFTGFFAFGFWNLSNGGTEMKYELNLPGTPAEQAQKVKDALKDFDANISVQVLPQEGSGTVAVLHTVYTAETVNSKMKKDKKSDGKNNGEVVSDPVIEFLRGKFGKDSVKPLSQQMKYEINQSGTQAEVEVAVKAALKEAKLDESLSVQVLPAEEARFHVVLDAKAESKKKDDGEKQIEDVCAYVTKLLSTRLGADSVKPVSHEETEAAPIWLATLLLMGAGFCIYGPQALIGIVAANQATKEAAAMANGFTGIMGYASTTVSGIGIAVIKEHFGWGPTLGTIAGFAIVGMVLFLFAWNAQATGYKKKADA